MFEVTFLEGKCGHAAIDFVSDRMIFNINLYSWVIKLICILFNLCSIISKRVEEG